MPITLTSGEEKAYHLLGEAADELRAADETTRITTDRLAQATDQLRDAEHAQQRAAACMTTAAVDLGYARRQGEKIREESTG